MIEKDLQNKLISQSNRVIKILKKYSSFQFFKSVKKNDVLYGDHIKPVTMKYLIGITLQIKHHDAAHQAR